MTILVRGLIVKTDLDSRYFFEGSADKDPTVCVNDIAEQIADGLVFLKCIDMFGEPHFVSVDHLCELFVGNYTISEDTGNEGK